MYSKFEGLDDEKRQRILNAAMKEFAAKGFDRASTNEIVKMADIAKGLLFHYFKSKKQLFLYIYDYSIELFIKEIRLKANAAEKDFFVKIQQIQKIKLGLVIKYPKMFDFLMTAYMEESADVKEDLDNRNRGLLNANTANMLEHIDLSKFKQEIDVRKAINVILWAYEGFANSILKRSSKNGITPVDYEKAFEEADAYTELLKLCFYK